MTGLPPLPYPESHGHGDEDSIVAYYTADQMRAYAAAAVAKERERCAKLCEATALAACDLYGDGAECIATGDLCAEAIRSISSAAGTSGTPQP